MSDHEYYLSTDWRKLSNPKVWVDAAEQVFSQTFSSRKTPWIKIRSKKNNTILKHPEQKYNKKHLKQNTI